MTTWNRCLSAIQEAAGRPLSDDEMEELIDELQARVRQARAEDAAGSSEDAVLRAAEQLAQDMKTAALIEKRNAALSLRRRLEALDFVRTQFRNDYAQGLEALMVGVNRVGIGNRASAAAHQNQLTGHYLGGFIADLQKGDLWPLFVSNSLDREIARALWLKGQKDADLSGIPTQARQIADMIAKWQDVARIDANKAGAWIRKLPGYIVRQSHDVYRIRSAGFETWRDYILPRLDPVTFANVKNLDQFLRETYSGLASGVHLKAAMQSPEGFKGPGNLAKRLSHERVLHFRDADAWLDYNERFGMGGMNEAVLFGLERMARATGLLRALGPNPEANFSRIMDELAKDLKNEPEKLDRFARQDRNWLMNRFAEVDGSIRIPANAMGARVASVTRAWQSMAKLGGAVLSAVTDIPIYASEMRYQGQTMLSGMGEALSGLMRGRGSKERQEVLGMLGVFFDSQRGDVISRFSAADDLPGRMSWLMQKFFKFNGLTWWTDTMRASAADAMSHRLALNRDVAWGGLDEDLRRVLGLYGLDGGKWEIIRATATRMADERDYIVPEGVRDAPDELLSRYLAGKGLEPTAARVRELRDEIETQLRSYFVDRTSYAVIEPDQRTHAIIRRGTRPGTVEGEFLRFIGQFKSFPVAVIVKSIGREVFGRGYAGDARGPRAVWEALRAGNGEMLGLAQLMLWTTLFGYGAMTAKDLAKGRTPRDPADPTTWAAAMTQGGGLGIYGDFLFGELRTRFGGGPIATALGPVAGVSEDILDIIGRMKNGDDAAAASFRTLLNNTPFLNLFYTRIALDYLILNRIQESLNPGYLRRYEQRVRKENAQDFWLAPSEAL
ncbi:hypothetical protein [Rhodoligotrophos defluvii]|uniref:hypothetical protein n=1 Tax=Rhodoligotrophos defluvii TaxID=2561934 RepID=UPI0010C9F403|nr:hypothetical protein [Rhodoligotrophos defluvii]